MQYQIPATFADENGYKAGLSPVITIREWDEVNNVYKNVVSTTMQDCGLGDYIYTFIAYDKSKLYTYKIDGGSDELTSRYSTGNNELDHYTNKVDWGTQFRGAIGGFSDGFYKEMKKLEKLLEECKPKDVDFTKVFKALEEIKSKEYKNEDVLEKLDEIEDKLEDKSDKIEIISFMKNNKPDLTKLNDTNREIFNKLLEQIKEDRELIEEMKEYIQSLVKRGDVKKDKDFKELMEKIKEEDMESLKIYVDEDFNSLVNELGQYED